MSDNLNGGASGRPESDQSTESADPVTSPAGWYPDPHNAAARRYWDGTAWTDHTTHPADVVPSPAAAPAPAGPVNADRVTSPTVAPAAAVPVKKPWYRRLAIVIPVSVVAALIVFVVVVGSLNRPAATSADDEKSAAQSENAAEPAADDEEPEEEPAAAAPVDLELGETAFGVDVQQGTGWYAVQVTNPNDDYVFGFAEISVEAYDAAGVLIDSDSTYTTILSGESWYTGTFFDIGSATIDHLEVRGPVASEATYSAAEETGHMTIQNVTTGSEYGRMTVTGQLVSAFSEDQDLVRIDLIARDASGKVVGVDFTFTDRVPAGGTVAWETSFWEVPLDSTVSAYPHL